MERITQIHGSKKGSSSGGAVEASDTLRSKAYARVLDAISEGEIEGLVNGPKSIYLNNTPLQGADGTFNFDVKVDLRHGSQGQPHIEGFPSVENEVQVAVEVKKDTPVVRTVTNGNVDAIRVKVLIPQLSSQDKKTGDLNGSSVSIAVEIQSTGGQWTRVVEDEISGKTMSRYERSYRVELTGTAPWNVRIVRLTDDSKDSAVANKTIFSSITEIIDTKLSYPNTALVGIRVDASQFDSIPTRSYHMRLLRVQVPSNYDPVARTYAGAWDGTFKIAWTNNPAWCFYDLVTSERYGLGQHVLPNSVDKWTLYSIGKYCDELVPDGKGGTEPRFALNVYLQTREEAYKLLTDMAGAFRGMLYWSGGSIVMTQDAPGDASYLFTNSNVIEGEFSYSGSSVKARHTVALVTWNDLTDMGRQKVEYVEDAAGVAQFGVISTEVVAFGCTSQAQAHRLGRWILLSELTETETVTFSTGMEGVAIAPGRIIKVRDNYRYGKRLGGRVVESTTSKITLDSEVTLAIDDNVVYVIAPDGKTHTSKVTGGGNVLSLSTPMEQLAVRGATWVLSVPGQAAPRDYRVVSVTEKESGIYDVTALEHNPEKYQLVDDVTNLGSSGGAGVISAPRPPAVPSDLKVAAVGYMDGVVQKYKLLASWASADADTAYWELEQRHESSNPVMFQNIAYPSLEIPDAKPGYHTIRVRAAHPKGIRSGWASASPVYVGKKITDVTGAFDSAGAKSIFLAVKLNWVFQKEALAAGSINVVEIWASKNATADAPATDPIMIGRVGGQGTEFVHADLLPGVKYTYRLRAIDQAGNKGDFYPPEGMVGEAASNIGEIIDRLDDSFRGSQFYRDLTSQIEEIDIAGLDSVPEIIESVADISDSLERIRRDQERSGDLLLRSVVVDEEVRIEARDAYARALDVVRIVEDGLALEVSRREALEAVVGDTAALVASEQVARADGDEALASNLSALQAQVVTDIAEANALIVNEQTARSTADQALATQLNALQTKFASDIAKTDAAVVSEQTARSTADGALAADLSALSARFNNFNGQTGQTVEAVVISDRQARANGDQALATSVNGLTARFDNYNASGKPAGSFEAVIASESQARANGDSANAQLINQVTARMNNAGGSGVTLEQSFTAQASAINGLRAQYSIKIDNNGHVSGFGLSSEPANGAPISTFAVAADRFMIASPTTGGVVPFQVYSSATYVNGAYVPAGVYIKDAFIRNAMVNSIHIAGNAVSVALWARGPGLAEVGFTVPDGETWEAFNVASFDGGSVYSYDSNSFLGGSVSYSLTGANSISLPRVISGYNRVGGAQGDMLPRFLEMPTTRSSVTAHGAGYHVISSTCSLDGGDNGRITKWPGFVTLCVFVRKR